MKIKNQSCKLGILKCLLIICVPLLLTLFLAFTNTYDTATPAGTDDPREADDRMREIKASLQERLDVAHYFQLTGTQVSDANVGYHRFWHNIEAYGATGGNDTDNDATGIQAAVDAASSGDAIYFPDKSFKITSAVTCDKNLYWLGVPGGTEILVSVGSSTDALTIDGTSFSTQHTVMKNLSFIGATDSCRAAIKLSEVHRSLFENIWIRTGGDEGFDIEDTLSCTFINCGSEAWASTNSDDYSSPDRMYYFHTGGASVAPNTHILINPIIYGSAANHYAIQIEDGGNCMRIIGGNIENCTGGAIYIDTCRSLSLEGTYIETLTGTYGIYIKDSYRCNFDFWLGSNETAYFENSDYNYIKGLVGSLTFDSASHGNTLGDIYVATSSGLVDEGSGNVLTGNIFNAGSTVYHEAGGPIVPLTDGANLFTNADISWWDAGTSAVPKGFNLKNTPTVTQESTIVKFGDYSCKVVADTEAQQEGVRFDSLTALDGSWIDDEWISCTVWVYNSTAGANIELQTYFTGSARTAKIDSTTATNTWTRLSAVTKMPSGASNTDVAFQVIADDQDNTTFYVDGVSICQGVGASRSMMPSSNLDEREKGISLLATGENVNMNTTAKTDLYTIPTGMRAIITNVVLRHPSANNAGPTDLNLGDGASADNWEQGLNISTLNATTEIWYINKSGVKDNVVYDAGDVFGIKPDAATGTTLSIHVDVFGYLFDA